MIDLEEIKIKIKEQYTQEEFAKIIGENQQTISAWFSRGNIPRGKVAKVLNALKMDIKNIINETHADAMLSVKIATVEAGASKLLNFFVQIYNKHLTSVVFLLYNSTMQTI